MAHTVGKLHYRESFFGPSGIGTPALSHGDTASFMCWLNMSGAYGGNSGIERARADAKRVAVCWNACEGIADPAAFIEAAMLCALSGDDNELRPALADLRAAAIAKATATATGAT